MIALLLVAQLLDSVPLKHVADSVGVPTEVLYAVAWKETGNGRAINEKLDDARANAYRGAGREQCDSTGCKRTCREVGRMQINPCIRWALPYCVEANRTYASNIRCGAYILKHNYEKYKSWPEAIRRYNGNGPMSRRYLNEALAFIGKRRIS